MPFTTTFHKTGKHRPTFVVLLPVYEAIAIEEYLTKHLYILVLTSCFCNQNRLPVQDFQFKMWLDEFCAAVTILGAVTMLLLVFKFIVGLYIACFNGSRFVAVTFFSAECRDMRCFYVL